MKLLLGLVVTLAPCIVLGTVDTPTAESDCAAKNSCLLGTALPVKPVEEEVRALIGREHPTPFFEQRIVDDLSCIHYGSGPLFTHGHEHEGWSDGLARCQERYVAILRKQVRGGKNIDDHRWRIVDAHLLPQVVGLQIDTSTPEGPYLFTPDECVLSGKEASNFYAVVRLSNHKRMDWRTGVLGAWGYDMKQKRIVPLDTKRVVCHKPEPE